MGGGEDGDHDMTRDDILRMAREVFDVETDSRGRETFSGDNYGVERFAALVAATEREQCAKVCENKNTLLEWPTYAAAIRARSAA